MARQNRSEVFDPKQVSVMHCINRAVRRAMLCGWDPYSGQSFEHRRHWVKQRLIFLAGQYAIDVLGYTVMSNHLHVILRNRPDVVETWSDQDVARRIWNLFPQRKNPDGSAAEPRDSDLNRLMACRNEMEKHRRRLSDISWLMRQLTEHIARRANAEDQCTGRFWEGRFKSQPLLDEAALLACSAYVDLNPIRAKVAETPEASDFTSVQDRIESEKLAAGMSHRETPDSAHPAPTQPAPAQQASAHPPSTKDRTDLRERLDQWLAPVYLDERHAPGPMVSRSDHRASDKGFLPMKLRDYLKLVDWTGRQLHPGQQDASKRGRIPADCRPILERLGLSGDRWFELVKDFGRLFKRVAGSVDSLRASATAAGLTQRRSCGGPALLSG